MILVIGFLILAAFGLFGFGLRAWLTQGTDAAQAEVGADCMAAGIAIIGLILACTVFGS